MLFVKRDRKIEMLKKVPMFSVLSKRYLVEIARNADTVAVEAGSVLAKEGKRGSEFFLIVEGNAQVQKNGRTIRQLTSGDFFGEISLIDQGPRTASVVAETDLVLLVVNPSSFDRLLNTIAGLQRNIMLALCKYVRSEENRPLVQLGL
jgi:CRP-like cAMP-binding protein